jgi:predicted DNA-binding transcriptional regulator YafY
VFAYCHLREDFRFFKTGRIESATYTEQKFSRRDVSKQDLPLNFWQANLETEDVQMEIDKSCLSDVEEWLGIENVFTKNGKHYAHVKLPYDNGLVSKIMSYGNGIKVISPTSLINKIKNSAEKIISTYKK